MEKDIKIDSLIKDKFTFKDFHIIFTKFNKEKPEESDFKLRTWIFDDLNPNGFILEYEHTGEFNGTYQKEAYLIITDDNERVKVLEYIEESHGSGGSFRCDFPKEYENLVNTVTEAVYYIIKEV